jgi:hypothetical protein
MYSTESPCTECRPIEIFRSLLTKPTAQTGDLVDKEVSNQYCEEDVRAMIFHFVSVMKHSQHSDAG